jgi:hypothetical protein
MNQTCEFLHERLLQDGEKTVAFFDKLTEKQWKFLVYDNNQVEWKVREVLAHFVASEASFARLIENILAGGHGTPEQFNIDAFNQAELDKLSTHTPAELLVQFQQLRQTTLDLVDGMHQSDLMKVGRHPFLGEVPLSDIIRLIYRHNQIHLRDMKRIIY